MIKPSEEAKKPPEPSLYEKFGDDQKWTLFVDEIVNQFMEHPDLKGPHKRVFQDSEQIELFKYKMLQYFKFLAGGSKRYLGKSLEDVHRHMGISEALFDKSKDIILAAMKKMRPRPVSVLIDFMKRIEGLRF